MASSDILTESASQEPAEQSHDRGASLVEYALLLALIAVVCIGAMGFFGTSLSDDYNDNASSMFATD